MKRTLALLTLLALVLSFAACGKEQNGGFGGLPEEETYPFPTLADHTALNITSEIKVGNMNMTQTYSYLGAGTVKLYSMSRDGFVQYYADTNGTVKGYSWYHGQTEYVPIELEDPSCDGGHIFALYGFDGEKYLEDFTFEKTGEEQASGFDCAVYDVGFTIQGEEMEMRVWQDKESGIWVKSTYTVEGEKYELTVTDISNEIPDMPGTIPVSVTPGEVYSRDGLTLNLKGIEFDPTYAAILKLEAVNATDSDLKVKSRFFDVNGLCIGGTVFSESVPAGESLDFDVKISDKSCDIAGVDMIEEMAFSISAEKYHTEESGEGSHEVSEGMLIERSEEIKVSSVCPTELPREESGERRLLCKAEGFTAYFGGIRENSSGGYDFVVYYESEFDEDIRLTVNIHEVDGKVYDDFEKVYVYAGRKGFGGFSFWSDKVTEKPASVKLSFEAYYGEKYNGTCILEETEPFVLTVG